MMSTKETCQSLQVTWGSAMKFNNCGSCFWASLWRMDESTLKQDNQAAAQVSGESRKTAALTQEWILVSSQIQFGLQTTS